MTDATGARAILEEFGIEPVLPSAHLRPGQTKAVASLQKVINKRGYDHARFVIQTWKETNIQKTLLDASTMWALSDTATLVGRHFPRMITQDVESWFKFIDGLPIGWLQDWSRDVDGVIPRRYAMAGMIYERVIWAFEIRQPDLLDDRNRRTA